MQNVTYVSVTVVICIIGCVNAGMIRFIKRYQYIKKLVFSFQICIIEFAAQLLELSNLAFTNFHLYMNNKKYCKSKPHTLQ